MFQSSQLLASNFPGTGPDFTNLQMGKGRKGLHSKSVLLPSIYVRASFKLLSNLKQSSQNLLGGTFLKKCK